MTSTDLVITFETYVAFNLDGSPGNFPHSNIFIDLDNNSATGWPVQGADPPFGSEFLIQVWLIQVFEHAHVCVCACVL